MREIRTSGATRGEVALRVLPYSTAFALEKLFRFSMLLQVRLLWGRWSAPGVT